MGVISFATKAVERVALTFPFLTKALRMNYKKVVENEIALGQISCRDNVLCIGGGPLPYTALEIADRTGAKVEIVDNDMYAVRAAKGLVEKLNMSDKISVVYGDGQEIDTSEFSVIHVAMQAEPHDRILENIWQKSKVGARILLRRPNDGLEVLYSNLPEGCHYPTCNLAGQNSCTIKETLLFTKGQGREIHEETAPYHGRAAAGNCPFLGS